MLSFIVIASVECESILRTSLLFFKSIVLASFVANYLQMGSAQEEFDYTGGWGSISFGLARIRKLFAVYAPGTYDIQKRRVMRGATYA